MRDLLPLLLAAAAAFAQAPQADVLREIRAKGHKRFSEAEVIRISGLKLGAPLSPAAFEAMRDRMLGSGCIETVSWTWAPLKGGGYTATIEISEPDQFLPWLVDRLPLSAEDIAAAAAYNLPCFGDEIPTYDSYLTRAGEAVTRAARARGFNEEVIAKIGIAGKGRPAVIFQPKSPPPAIIDVRFTGVSAIDEKWLRRQIADVARGVPYSDHLFREFLENQIRPMYESVGRLTVQFGKVTTAPAKDVKGVVVTVEVAEGPAFLLEDVEFNGLPMDRDRVESIAEFKRGEPVSYSMMAITMEKLFKELRNNGYVRPSYKARRQLNVEQSTVKLMVDVDAGPQYRMGRLTVRGLDVISEPVIRKMWTMPSGDPYRDDYPDFFLNSIRERGVLDFLGATRAEKKMNDDARTVDVVLIFEAGAHSLDSRRAAPPKKKQ